MKVSPLRWLGLCVTALTLAVGLRAEPVLAGHPGLHGQTLDADGVKAVLLGKKITLGDTRVTIVIIRNSDAQNAFLGSRVGMTTNQFRYHWRRLFMTGGGTAPQVVEGEADAVKLAAATPGAIVITDSTNAGELVRLDIP